MELGNIIIGAILVACCFMPFIIMNRNTKKREHLMLTSLSQFAMKYNGQISQSECLGNIAIGIDETINYLFYYKRHKDQVEEKYINLSDIQQCRILNTNRTVGEKNNEQKVIDRLDLSFIPRDQKQSEIALEFYNSSINLQMYGELLSVEKWSKMVNERLQRVK